MAGLTLDTGALIALERGKRRMIAAIDTAKLRGLRVTVPSAVVVEWWRGQHGPSAHLLDGLDVEPLTNELAHIAGEALAAVGGGPSVVDAVVMASAAQRGDVVYRATSKTSTDCARGFRTCGCWACSKPTSGGQITTSSARRAGAHGDLASAFVLAAWFLSRHARTDEPTKATRKRRSEVREVGGF